MSLMSFILIGSLLFILLNGGETIQCPSEYNTIGMGYYVGCYKLMNGSNFTWSNARQSCLNDSSTFLSNETVPTATTHLMALENETETTALFYWMKAYALRSDFWTDGIVSTSSWNWSNQSIIWYFSADERAVIGNGSNYKIVYNQNQSNYQIADDINSKELNFICEYQVPCNETNSCVNNAKCYLNFGQELCLCAPGFTGQLCETEIDECLSSPCLHDGNCINAIDNYTCDCSNAFYDGPNCEIPKPDPTQSERTAAFWSVLGIVTGFIVILTILDLPWGDILSAIRCSCHCFKCCSKQNDDTHINENNLRLSDSPTNDQNYERKKISMPDGTSAPKGMNYHVMNSVWDPEYIPNPTQINSQYNGYRSPDQNKIPENLYIQSFASLAIAKRKQKELENQRVYAVNINEPTSKPKDPVDTMVNWTQQLQEQLRNKKPRQTSASSTKQLIHSLNSNDN